MKTVTGFFMAWGNFCAIPCPCKKWDEKARTHMLVMFPIIGLMMGLLWSALFWAVLFLELPIPVSAALLTAYPFVVSGFIHLDGFMDCNDAIQKVPGGKTAYFEGFPGGRLRGYHGRTSFYDDIFRNVGNRGRRRFVDFLVPDGNSGLFQGNVCRFGHVAQAPFHQPV